VRPDAVLPAGAVTRPAVVIVMGPAGAGKTTVGLALAGALGWAFHDADDFHDAGARARMQAGVPLTDADRAPWLARLAALVAGVLAGGGSAVLACSALRRGYRAALVPPDAPPGRVRLVHLDVPRAVLAARLTARAGHFAGPALLDSQLAALEPPGDDEPLPALTVDATRPVPEIVAAVRLALEA
jgi:gluconokinase